VQTPPKTTALLTLATLFLVASTQAAQPAIAAGPTLSIRDIAFPLQIEVAPGETVTWTNDEPSMPHDVVSGAPDGPDARQLFASAVLLPGQIFSFTFSEPGSYDYFCSLHPYMRGTVIVASATEPPPSSAGQDSQ